MNLHYKNIFIKLLIFFIFLFIIGLPINNSYGFYTLLLLIPIIIFSKISLRKRSTYFIFFSILFFSIFKFSFPTISIQEGHNLVLLNNNSFMFYKKNLPYEIYDFFNIETKNHYSHSQCDEKLGRCWKNFNPNQNNTRSSPTNEIFAISSDWSFKKIKYSRIVDSINFSNLKSAKIGAINNLDYNFFWLDSSDIQRENTPFFVMYEISKELSSSSFCWKGNLFWEKTNNSYSRKFNKYYDCNKISNSDVGKKIYGTSMGTKNELILKLEKSTKLKFMEIINLFFKFFVIISIIYFVFRINYKLFSLSLLSIIGFVLVILYVNKDLIQGFDIFTGGNDGILYMSYGNVIFNNLVKFNFYESFRGAESIFYFPSSLRYFWSINKIFFGETFFGYLIIGFLYPIIFFYIFKCLLGTVWSVILTLIVTFTRLLEGYALSLISMLKHINVGDAEPFAIFFLLGSVLIFLKFTNGEIRMNSIFYNLLFGFSLFLSVSLRPNYLPTAFIFILALTFYNFFYHNNLKSSFFIAIGFMSILLIPLHNLHYGNAYVLLSSAHKYNTHAPLWLYFDVLKDLIQLRWNQDSIAQLTNQFNRWIQPQELHYIVAFIILLFLLIKSNNIPIKILCLLALSQHFVLLIFEPTNRYAYLAWILTIMVNLYFIKNNLFHSKFGSKIKKIIFK